MTSVSVPTAASARPIPTSPANAAPAAAPGIAPAPPKNAPITAPISTEAMKNQP